MNDITDPAVVDRLTGNAGVQRRAGAGGVSPLRRPSEFETPGEPIAGTLSVEGERQPFTGWLGLMSGLQRAVDDRGVADSARIGDREHDA